MPLPGVRWIQVKTIGLIDFRLIRLYSQGSMLSSLICGYLSVWAISHGASFPSMPYDPTTCEGEWAECWVVPGDPDTSWIRNSLVCKNTVRCLKAPRIDMWSCNDTPGLSLTLNLQPDGAWTISIRLELGGPTLSGFLRGLARD
jgi:hypothetical protein